VRRVHALLHHADAKQDGQPEEQDGAERPHGADALQPLLKHRGDRPALVQHDEDDVHQGCEGQVPGLRCQTPKGKSPVWAACAPVSWQPGAPLTRC